MTDASKVALVGLCDYLLAHGFRLIDSQVHTSHLESLGAEMMPRSQFAKLIKKYTAENDHPGHWTCHPQEQKL